MTTIVTRIGKGSELTYAEMDANLTNLNNDKAEVSSVPVNVSDLPNDAGYISTETDPVFMASPAASVQILDMVYWSEKQEALVSGTNIKTINNISLLGSGNIAVQPVLSSGTNIKTINNISLLGSGNIAVQPVLSSGSNIKTFGGLSILGSGDLPCEVSSDNTPVLGGNLNVNGFIITNLQSSGSVSITTAIGGTGSIDIVTGGTGYAQVNTHRFPKLSQTLHFPSSIGTVDQIMKLGGGNVLSYTSVKTINGSSIFGTGDIVISGGTETDPVFVASPAFGITSTNITDWSAKQEQLVSGTNIKTINGSSILGSGDITISGGSGTSESFHPFLLAGM
jgi:hypothetical protein